MSKDNRYLLDMHMKNLKIYTDKDMVNVDFKNKALFDLIALRNDCGQVEEFLVTSEPNRSYILIKINNINILCVDFRKRE